LFDDRLIEQVRQAGPDQGRKIAKQWQHDRDDAGSAAEKYERQRRLRSARRYDTTDGLAAITVEGDDATIDAMWNRLVADADGFYQSDGGRDVPAGSHRRTNHQRLFDACVDALGGGADDRSRTGSQRPTFVVTATLDKLGGRKLSEAAEQVGTGPIADALLAIYLEDADVIGMVFGGDGQPLWLGRKRRHASAAQFLALTIRDRGCVLCGAAASRCEAHHLTPWNAPRRGQTDIDQLALVCSTCHHEIHDSDQTLQQDPASRVWQTRSARRDELPIGRNRRSERKPACGPERSLTPLG